MHVHTPMSVSAVIMNIAPYVILHKPYNTALPGEDKAIVLPSVNMDNVSIYQSIKISESFCSE